MSTKTETKLSPLSFAQQRLWLAEQIEQEVTHYNIPIAFQIRGNLNIPKLERCLNVIVGRHEALRTSIHLIENTPLQVISNNLPLTIEQIPTNNQSGEKIIEWIKNQIKQKTAKKIDLSKPPLFKALVFRISDNSYVLSFIIHHIIIDAWSMEIMYRELSELYNSDQETKINLAPTTFNYSDYSLWQQKAFSEGYFEDQLNYWKQQFDNPPELVELPLDHVRTVDSSHNGAVYSAELSLTVPKAIHDLSKIEHTTPFVVYLAAFYTLLYKYTHSRDLVVGCSCAGRTREDTENLLGFFVNILPLRNQLSPKTSLRELLLATRDISFNAFTNQDIPFNKIVEAIKLDRSHKRSPLFQVAFTFLHYSINSMCFDGIDISPLHIEKPTSEYDLTLSINDSRSLVIVEYNSTIFEEDTIKGLITHYQIILDAFCHSLNNTISDISILSKDDEASRYRINHNSFRPTHSHTVKQLLEDQANLSSDRIAVTYKTSQLTYGQLNSSSNQLAHYILKRTLKPQSTICIMLERSTEMLISVLASIKSGNCYVPVDPAFPINRVEFILNDSQFDYIITTRKYSNLIRQLNIESSAVIYIDEIQLILSNEPDENISKHPSENDLIYIIYTSGSTGTPKGVEIEQHSVVNLLESMKERIGITQQDTFLAITTLSFDIACMELLLPLMTGCSLHIAPQDILTDGTALAKHIQDIDATFLQATPATWQMLINSKWEGKQDLTALTGGEAISPTLTSELLNRTKHVWNLYGPTETTIWSSAHHIISANEIFLGEPISNTRFYIMDDDLSYVPIGIPGELYIEGAGLARGYHFKPELTLERFINKDGVRLYKTGDLVKFDRSGRIIFLGRKDNQIKIRGFRIETAEIIAVLLKNTAVAQCIVEAKQHSDNDKRIYAYIILKENTYVTDIELRAFLKDFLPEYMVPSSFVFLTKFPLTPNGKIDRKALPDPLQIPRSSGNTAPRSQTEQLLKDIWIEVLRVNPLGIYDNFFELGGHSLLAVQLTTRIRDAFEIELPVRAIFDDPTIHQLANHLDRHILRKITSQTFKSNQSQILAGGI